MKFFKLLMILLIGLLCGCGTQDTTSGTPSPSVASLGLAADKDTINSDGLDTATLTVRALDTNNVAMSGVAVTLSASAGALSTSSVTTDDTGEATFSFDSGLVSNNQVATITASTASIAATKTITILGTSVTLTSDKTSVGLNGASTATLTAAVRDGGGNPVSGVSITLASVNGLGTINGTSSITQLTNNSGVVTAAYLGGATAGTDTIRLTGPDTIDLSMLISGSQFNLTDSLSGSVSYNSTDNITLTWIDTTGAPVNGTNVTLSASKGTFDATGNSFITGTTDANGQFSTAFHPTTLGADTITATDGSLTATLPLTIYSDTPSTIALSANPSVVSRAQGGDVPTAVVNATVLDSLNRAVQGVKVAFSLTSGPGGGEGVSPAVATTNAAGIATTTFSSGGLISSQNGITILAKLVDYPTITDTTTMTIADQAATIVIGESNKISTLTIGSAEDAYALPFTVLVTDTNGSAIANQTVSLSLYPAQFSTGYFPDNTKAIYTISNTYANEDANRNGILDPGEDTAFANGRLDPGGVASIPASVITDSNGFAGFDVVYAKSYAIWVDVEISATTNVSGTESKSTVITKLKAKDGDTPYLDSPWGP